MIENVTEDTSLLVISLSLVVLSWECATWGCADWNGSFSFKNPHFSVFKVRKLAKYNLKNPSHPPDSYLGLCT